MPDDELPPVTGDGLNPGRGRHGPRGGPRSGGWLQAFLAWSRRGGVQSPGGLAAQLIGGHCQEQGGVLGSCGLVGGPHGLAAHGGDGEVSVVVGGLGCGAQFGAGTGVEQHRPCGGVPGGDPVAVAVVEDSADSSFQPREVI